jgi:hypothetical protein
LVAFHKRVCVHLEVTTKVMEWGTPDLLMILLMILLSCRSGAGARAGAGGGADGTFKLRTARLPACFPSCEMAIGGYVRGLMQR